MNRSGEIVKISNRKTHAHERMLARARHNKDRARKKLLRKLNCKLADVPVSS
jgi:hypothetical protein